VPGSVDDCCLALQRRGEVPDREAAQEWLPFLVALGLAGERDGDYYRKQVDPETEPLAERFREGVYGVSEVLDALAADGPLTAEAAFEATRDLVPRWERNRDPDWESTWRDRTRRCLEWGVELGLVRGDEADGFGLP
jgi:hypothetical protein